MAGTLHVKKNDTVQILAGKDKGKKGKVLQVFPKLNKVVVEGINMTVKNVRPKQQGEKGQVVRYNAPIHASNVKQATAEPTKSADKKPATKSTTKKTDKKPATKKTESATKK